MGAGIYHLWTKKFGPYKFNYRTRTIISHGLYIFFTTFITAVHIVEQFIMQSGKYFFIFFRTKIELTLTFLLYILKTSVNKKLWL